MKNKYLLLISWVAFSYSAGEQDTGVNWREDLIDQYKAGNPNVSAYPCDSRDSGMAKAFSDNYTMYNSVSALVHADTLDYAE